MSGERWSRIRAAFDRARELPERERRAFLDRELSFEPELRAEVERLLSAEAAAGEFLDIPGSDPALGSVGPYRLLELVGEGGFGVVYRAEQLHPIRRQVALKLIKPGMDTKDVMARFAVERQALALMDHPGIAQVFEAGETELGRPYFTMEHVPGVPVTRFCDENALDLSDRLRLFLDVCDAVHHAHQKGVIHRDLKPSNVLVTRRDGVPVPKIIDFGIAKATLTGLGDRTLATREGAVLGTLGTMSPEQAGAIEARVDTRTDIYSLGVLLYELLAGAPPFDPKRLRETTWTEAVRIIREEDPPPMAMRAAQAPEVEEIARRRHIEPRALLRELQGDLEWITRRALEKEPDRRYPSVSELAADVRRHLANEPVLAGAPTTAYRIRKFVRRHRAAVSAGGAVFALLLVAVAVTTWGMLRARRAEQTAARGAAIAEAVNSFLNDDLLAAAAPSARRGRGRDALVRDVLDAAASRIDEAAKPGGRFAGEPFVEASIRTTLSRTYVALGEYDAAEPHAKRAIELLEAHPESPALAARIVDLGMLYLWSGRHEEAEALLERALEIRKRVAPEDSLSLISTTFNLATVYKGRGRYDEAEPMFVGVLAALRRLVGDDAVQTMEALNNLGNLYSDVGRFAEAESLQTELLAARVRTEGEESPGTLFAMNNLANTLLSQGQLTRALTMMTRTLDLKRKVFGPEHPSTLNSLASLGSLHSSLGDHAQAERFHGEALALREKALGAGHPSVQSSRNDLAFALLKQGRYGEADALASKSLAVCRETLGAHHPTTNWALLMIALCQEGQSRVRDAESSLRQALAQIDSTEAADPMARWIAEAHLGLVLGRLDRRDESEAILLRVLPQLPDWESESRDILQAAIPLLERWGAERPTAGLDEQVAALRRRLSSM